MTKYLEVVDVPTDELVPYANNAKLHPHEQVDQIAESIRQFGFNDPIAVWTNADGELEIVEGHGRLMAAKLLGLQTVPTIRLDHLTDEQRRAYTHVHNKLNMNSGFDLEILGNELESIDFEWEEFGFDVFDLAEAATATDGFVPRSEEISMYSEQGEGELKSYNVVICCLDQEEQAFVKELLQEEGRLKRLYMAAELMERLDA